MMNDSREPTKEEREQDINFLTHILFEIRDYAISCGQESDDMLKNIAEWILAMLKVNWALILNVEEEIERSRKNIENAKVAGLKADYAECNKYIDSKRQLVDWLKKLNELREKVKQPDSGSISCEKPENTHVRTTDDLIRRQDAIDAMCSVCGNDCDKSEFVYDAPQCEQVILCPEHYALSVLPSAQREPYGGEQ